MMKTESKELKEAYLQAGSNRFPEDNKMKNILIEIFQEKMPHENRIDLKHQIN